MQAATMIPVVVWQHRSGKCFRQTRQRGIDDRLRCDPSRKMPVQHLRSISVSVPVSKIRP